MEKTYEWQMFFGFVIFIGCVILMVVLLSSMIGCSGGSSSGGNHTPLKSICQTCTYGNECESGWCGKFKSGMWRCLPENAQPGYTCPAGQYKLPSLDQVDPFK